MDAFGLLDPENPADSAAQKGSERHASWENERQRDYEDHENRAKFAQYVLFLAIVVGDSSSSPSHLRVAHPRVEISVLIPLGFIPSSHHHERIRVLVHPSVFILVRRPFVLASPLVENSLHVKRARQNDHDIMLSDRRMDDQINEETSKEYTPRLFKIIN